MPRGRPMNPLRVAACSAGERFYCDGIPCDFCASDKRYVANGNCVACAIARGKARYASADKDAWAAADHARYLMRRRSTRRRAGLTAAVESS